MKFRKDKWERVRLGDVCEKVTNVDIRKQSGTFNYIDIGSIDSNLKRVLEVQVLDWQNASSRARQIVKQGDTLFSTVRINLEKIAFLDKEFSNAIASTGFTVIRANRKAIANFLFYSIISPELIDKLCKLQKGTAYPAVTDKIVFDQEILLPPLEEQRQIATLFQSLENAIEQVESQEKNLKALQKKLSSSLISRNPIFGNLLTDKNCNLCTFEDITNCVEKHDKKPLENGITRFIGLEFIEAENFNLQGFGEIEKGTTFTKCFLKNDVLFGKRRAYLKKVAVADFDGICSGDILVFRAKKEKMLPELLPYYVSSDAFIQHAVKTSAGSLSPRTKWKDLKEFKISIPDLKIQKKIAEIFQQLQLTLNQLTQQKINLKNLKQKLLSEILG